MSLFPKKSRVSLYGLWMMNRWMDVVHIPGLTPHHLSLHVFPKKNCWIFIIFYQNLIKCSTC